MASEAPRRDEDGNALDFRGFSRCARGDFPG